MTRNGIAKRRVISNTQPLFNFKGTKWESIPDEFKTFSAISIDSNHMDYNLLDDYSNRNISVVIQGEYYNSTEKDPMLPDHLLKDILDRYPNVIAISCVEMSCSGLVEEQKKRIIDTMNVCKDYGVYFIWEDMGYPDRKHVFAKAGEDQEFFDIISENRDLLIFVDKINGRGQFYLTRALAIGYWTVGLSAGWGINCEDFWWFENGLTEHNKESIGLKSYFDVLKNLGTGFANNMLSALEFACPEAFIGQLLGAALLQGATVISFENPDRVINYKDKLTPLFEKVIRPLKNMIIEDNIIPSRQEIIDKIKVIYCIDDWKSKYMKLPIEELFSDLYGCEKGINKTIKKNKCTGRILQKSGRYFILPVVPEFARVDAERTFANVLDSKNMPRKKRSYFDVLYQNETEGDASALHINDFWHVTNSNENLDIEQRFENLSLRNGEIKVSGMLKTHTFLMICDNKDKIKIHLNNFRTDSSKAIFKNPNFTRYSFLEDYLSDNCSFIGENRETALYFTGNCNENNIIVVGGDNISTTKKGNVLEMKISHNGPVELVINNSENSKWNK